MNNGIIVDKLITCGKYLITVLIFPIVLLFHPKIAVGIIRVCTYQTGILYSEKNEEALRELLSENNVIRTFVDREMTVGKYKGIIETKGYYGTQLETYFMEIWFKTTEDKLMFILKYPDRLTLGKEILKRGGSFDIDKVDISEHD